jgi:hypothetical protein
MLDKMRRGAVILVMCCAVAWTGCSYALRPPVVDAGRAFPEGRLGEIKQGDSPEHVRNVLGEPFQIEGSAAAGRWRYYMRVRGAEERRFLGFIPLPDAKSVREHEASVSFAGGRVDRVTTSRPRH